MLPSRTPAADALLVEQLGVARRDQLRRAGLHPTQLARLVAGNHWQSAGPTVVVSHNGPLTPAQEAWVAVLAARARGTPAALAGRSAAAAWGLTGWPADGVEIVVPRGARPALPAGLRVRVHESRRFTTDDIHPTARPHRVRLERALLDGASWTPRPRSACGFVLSAVQQRRTTAARLVAELDRVGRVRHCALLRWLLVDAEGGAHALSEVDLGRVLGRFGLPAPERQVVRVVEGRRRYVDAKVCGPDGRSVLIEVDGAVHLLPMQAWDDDLRLNELVILAERVLRFPVLALHLAPEVVASQVARALGLPFRLRAVPRGSRCQTPGHSS